MDSTPIDMTWPSPDNPAALPELPPGQITWDTAGGEWLVDGRPVPPGRYRGPDGRVVQLLDPANPDDCIL